MMFPYLDPTIVLSITAVLFPLGTFRQGRLSRYSEAEYRGASHIGLQSISTDLPIMYADDMDRPLRPESKYFASDAVTGNAD